MRHAGVLFLRLTYPGEGCTQGVMVRGGLWPVGVHPVERGLQAFEEIVAQAETDDTRTGLYLARHRVPLPLEVSGAHSGPQTV